MGVVGGGGLTKLTRTALLLQRFADCNALLHPPPHPPVTVCCALLGALPHQRAYSLKQGRVTLILFYFFVLLINFFSNFFQATGSRHPNLPLLVFHQK